MLHRGTGHGQASLVVLALALLIFAASVLCAATLLPARINVYFAPSDSPDVVYERWQYLVLVVFGAGALAIGFGALSVAFASVIKGFFKAGPLFATDVATWVAAWVLVWLSGTIWLAIWLGNESAERRSWFELFLGMAGVAGVVAVTFIRARIEVRNGPA